MTEAQIEQVVDYAMCGIAIIPAIIISLIHEKKRNKRPEMVNTKPYTWGYFTGWVGMIFGGELIAGCLYGLLVGEIFAVDLFIGGLLMALGYGIIKRNAIAWIISIIISFNPFGWVINGIYLKNRWSEFKKSGSTQEIQGTVHIPPPLPAKTPPPLPIKNNA
jgi:hypothetical protein